MRGTADDRLPIHWDRFSDQLRTYFDPFDKSDLDQDQLYKIQHRGGSFKEHVSKFKQLVLQTPNMDDADRVHFFINSMHEKICTHVLIHNPDTLEGATQLALHADWAHTQ